ncbi:hypothetical protein GOP47_0006424 [Adiantum capillus-veneris]|uniref:Uncharacterized protein n=1 Tax=Adiantum capillus-veneris TaxID=13818 RepID=A0A9D4V3U6_ADICA|nr:hypothetical protein GOP47_0006424 [Adiantum capillus-veneris]
MAEAFEVAAWLKSLPCAPEFRPTEAEFADPIAYISKIEAEARTYGICKIIPPFPRASKKTVMANLNRSLLLKASDSASSSAAHGSSACEPEVRRSMGGCMPPQKVGRRSMSGCCPPFQHPRTRSSPSSFFIEGDEELKAKFNTRRQQLGCSTGKRSRVSVQTLAQKLVWQSGESYTLEQFEAKAKQFSRARLKTSRDLPPFVIESLFWKAAADRTVTVEYGNDIPGSAFGEPARLATIDPTSRLKRKWSFDEENQVHPLQHPAKEPKLDDPGLANCADEFASQYRSSETASSCGISSKGKPSSTFAKERLRPRKKTGLADVHGGRAGSELADSFWNMKVMPRSPGSLLRYMPDEVPGVTSPMVYIGMLFSWFAWHVEDHELHSLNYLHIGAPKTWYAVPGDAAPALEEVVRVYGYGNCTDSKAAFTLLGEKTTVMSPEVLLAAGVPCCRLVQNAGEFVVTFPRAYHLGFSHGFNCGEAANFASPAWLEVAKDAATRRAAMNYLPMLSHQQLLYLLALSFSPRVPLALAFEPRSSRSKGTMSSSGEEAVKIVFTNDAAHNNRLLGLLVDNGVTGCVLISDGAELSSALSEHSKVSSSVVDNDLRTASFMDEMLSEACEIGNGKNNSGGSEDHGISSEDLKCFPEDCEIRRTTSSSFRWGTLPCAACGLLCFPSIAVVQPVSNIRKSLALAQQLNIATLPSFYLKEEEGHAADTGHLPSFFAMNHVDLQTDYMRASLSEGIYSSVDPLGKTSHWEMEQEAIQGCGKDSHGSKRKSLHCALSGEIGHANALQQDLEETQKFLEGSFNYQGDLTNECVVTKAANMEESNDSKLVLQKDKVVFENFSENVDQASFPQARVLAESSEDQRDSKNLPYQSSGSIFEGCENSLMLDNLLLVNDIARTGHRVTETGSATSVLDLLAVTYKDESEDSGSHGRRKKSVLPEVEHGGTHFHPHSSLLSDDVVGCTVDAPWHRVKEEAECASSRGNISKPCSFECAFATPLRELDNFLQKEVLLQKVDGSYTVTECTPNVDLGPFVQSVTKCISNNQLVAVSGKATSLEKEGGSLGLQGGHSPLEMPAEAREQFVGSEKASQLIAQSCRGSEVAGCGESKEALHSPLATHFSAGSSTFKIRTPNKVVILSDSGRQVVGSKDGDHSAFSTDKSVSSNFGQACSLEMGGTRTSTSMENLSTLDCHRTRVVCQQACTDGTSNAYVGANLDPSVNWMHIEGRDIGTLSMFEDSSTLVMGNNKFGSETDHSLKAESEDLCMENAEIWKRRTRDHRCSGAAHNNHDSSSSNASSRPRFLCLEHALEAHHQLKQQGGSQMLIICHSEITKIESHAQHLAEESSLTHSWRSITYSEATQEQKHLIDLAMKAEEEGEDYCEDWVIQLGMRAGQSENKTLSNFSNGFYGTDVSCEAKAEPLHSLDGAREDEAVGKVAMQKKVSVAGHWCGKVWMNDEVHPELGGCYTAQSQLQALQNSRREDNAKALFLEQQMCTTGTSKGVAKCAEETNLINSRVKAGFHPEPAVEAERTNKKRKVPEHNMNPLQVGLDSHTESPNGSKRRELAVDSATLDTSCLTSAVRKRSNSFEELVDFANQDTREDCCTLQSTNGNTSTSNGGNSQVSDVDVIDHDASDMDIWQDIDVGCYSQEVLSLDTIGGVTDPLMVETCHELDAEAQEDLIPSMLRSCSPFDCADFFCEGPSTRLRSRSVSKAVSMDDDEVVNGKHSELFGTGKRRKPPRQKPKKPVMKDLEEECGAYICELDGCSMSFSSKQELNLHKRNTCTFTGCGKRFGSHKYLLQHRRVHLDDRPLKCPWKGCKMTFKWKWACTEHYRVHTGERPYVCPIPECGRTFRFVSDFSRHKRKTGHTK